MKNDTEKILTEARLLLPWYSQGLLEPSQMNWMKIQLATYPELQQEKKEVNMESEWIKQQMKQINIKKHANNSQRLERLLEKIRQNEQPKHFNIFHQIKQWLFPSPEIGFWKAGASFALLLISIQAVMLIQNYSDTPAIYTTLSGESTLVDNSENLLLVSFQKNASAYQIQTLLLKHKLVFVQGPDPVGLYGMHHLANIDVDKLIRQLEAETQIISFIDKP